jgi:Protein of unknown function (DUF3306)
MTRQDDQRGGFLSRWSRLKQDTKRTDGESPVPQPPPLEGSGDARTAMEAPLALRRAEDVDSREQPSEQLPLPSLDDITPGADVAAFFQNHVPEALRTAALRKLWVTDPEIKGFIEMADYQWDFNNPDSIPGWSSTLKGVDVKAMAERIFNAVASETRQPDAVDAAGRTLEARFDTSSQLPADQPDSLSNSTESPMISNASIDSAKLEPAPAEGDAAVQDNPSGSNGYAMPRKRHGGALPT